MALLPLTGLAILLSLIIGKSFAQFSLNFVGGRFQL